MNTNLTKRQNAILSKARRILKREPWYRGVCMDGFPSERTCKEKPRQAIISIVMETAYWDAPNMGFNGTGDMHFRDIRVNAVFRFDGDTFKKTDANTAWELRKNRRYKEWAFRPNDLCQV